MKISKIEKLEKRYNKICIKLSCLSEFGASRKTYIKYKQKEIELKNIINQLLTPILEENNPEFKRIANQNHELLKSLNFKLKTRTTGASLLGYFTSEMKGSINHNGVVYFKTKKTNFPIIRLTSSFEFPSKFKGEIDCLGNIKLQATLVDAAFLKTIPSTFIGTIEKNGREIIVETTDRDYDLTFSGKLIVSEIVGNLFEKQNNNKGLFFSNKRKLESILEEYRMKGKLATTNKI